MSATLSVPDHIKFDRAIELTQEFLSELKQNKLSSEEIHKFVTDLVQTANGARGFFVTYLTSPDPICDEPRAEIIDALRSHPDVAADLLVKNIAMSTAQQLYHRRNNDPDMVASSATVAKRTGEIIQKLNLPQIQKMCQELVETIQSGTGNYSDFLSRWGYDDEQKTAIARAVLDLDLAN